jgi:hypothetical protein
MPPFARLVQPLLALMEHLGQMAQPSGDKTTREHLTALAMRGDRQAKALLRGPEVPSVVLHLYEWWGEVAAGRGAGGLGPAGLTWQDISGWMAVTQTEVTPLEAQTILRMDRAFLAAAVPPQRSK